MFWMAIAHLEAIEARIGVPPLTGITIWKNSAKKLFAPRCRKCDRQLRGKKRQDAGECSACDGMGQGKKVAE